MENDETPNSNNKKTITLDFQDSIIEVEDINDSNNIQKQDGENINNLASKINISNLTASKNKNENSIIELNEINPESNTLQNNDEEIRYDFTDFSEIDFFEFFHYQDKKKEKNDDKKENEEKNQNNIFNLKDNKSIEDEDEDEDEEELKKNRKTFIKFLTKNNVRKLKSNEDFNIGNFLYKHKDEIYKGNIINIPPPKKKQKNNFDENLIKNTFIKKVLIEKIYQIKLIYNEIQMFFKLVKHLKDNFFSEMFFNLNFYYYDKTEKYIYLFYSYPEGIMTIREKIIDIEKTKSSDTDQGVNKDKLLLSFKFVKVIILLHSNLILHRDLSIDYFYFLPNLYDKNEIQSGTLKTFDLYNCVQIPPKNELSKYQSLDEYINKNYLFITPKYVAPELTTIRPLYGWGQDIWSLACVLLTIFIKYTDLNEDLIQTLLNRIFRGESYINDENKIENNENRNRNIVKMYAIPKIPKNTPLDIAKVIAMCFYIDPRNRPNIFGLIEKINILLKRNDISNHELEKHQRDGINQLLEICRSNYSKEYSSNGDSQNNKKTRWLRCKIHKEKRKSVYCEKCKIFCCEDCINKDHERHKYNILENSDSEEEEKMTQNNNDKFSKNSKYFLKDNEKEIKGYLMNEKITLKKYQKTLERAEMEKNYQIIQEFKEIFEEDYEVEKKRIMKQYRIILEKLNEMEETQLSNLEDTKEKFEYQNQKRFIESKGVADYVNSLYSAKFMFFCLLNRFMTSLKNDEINSDNYLFFKNKLEKFIDFSKDLIRSGAILKKRCDDLYEKGKYIFRHEQYTENMKIFLDNIENKLKTEKFQPFDYTDSSTLSLKNELLTIIPLTNCVFSYMKSSYKKIKINFKKNNIRINNFLPGCATLNLENKVMISGGELKDEPTSYFLILSIENKELKEKTAMNFPRRFHSMINIPFSNDNYLFSIGGWDCNEVEYINSDQCEKWFILPKMNFKRSDCTPFYFNKKYIYVFGGWDYSNKKCVQEVERYLLFNEEDNDINNNNEWEKVEIKGEKITIIKYNMGLINLFQEETENSEKIILVGGFDESYDYSQSVVKVELFKNDNYIYVNKDIKGLPTGGESSFWYEKEFHLMNNEMDNELIVVNFNCFNNIFVYNFNTCEFKQYANQSTK